MTKRFTINKSRLVANSFVIDDKEKLYTFPTVKYHKEFLNSFCKALNELEEENEQLKQRNNRQAKQLDRLYNLIEEKDWRTLSDIIDDFKRCEEQLQQEWKCYE